MTRPTVIILLLVVLALLSLGVLVVAGIFTPVAEFDRQLQRIVQPYAFDVAQWQLRALAGELKVFLEGKHMETKPTVLTKYFSLVAEIESLKASLNALGSSAEQLAPLKARLNHLEEQRAMLVDEVERTLQSQIRKVLLERRIVGPEFVFPPMRFKLEPPPSLLVISPRDRILLLRRVLLRQDLDLEQRESIESEADGFGVSSLVVNLGGFAAGYPALISENASPRFIINAAVEEWLHQYLAFTPLGFLYLLDITGVRPDPDIVTMNETLVGMVSEEISTEVYATYYGTQGSGSEDSVPESELDFDREMKQTRWKVDQYLAQGNIEEAERYMEERRQYFVANGHYIRKLNQAYFAFYGIYAYEPASISPIYEDLKELRALSPSLKQFLDSVAGMTSYQELRKALAAEGSCQR